MFPVDQHWLLRKLNQPPRGKKNLNFWCSTIKTEVFGNIDSEYKITDIINAPLFLL